MAHVSTSSDSDGSQKRAVPVRARSQASREAIIQAAMALWRTKGFADTTVTDIAKAAGVSKALFYVYFARREDVLLEAETLTMDDAHRAAEVVVSGPYELIDVVTAVVETLERGARIYPPELVFETVLEAYRLERRALAGGATEADLAYLFLEPFRQAQRDGKLPAGLDVVRAARIAQVFVGDGVRCWAASGFGEQPLTPILAPQVTAIVEALAEKD
ncbi:HTH-type transcriptional regulator EthR [Nocardia cerradoensis]|uniref:HTH-type transcriptional regulator EthR n=1 Tax=Nocardia cerradoensis TaxID=85688 RepID=A0A231GUV5_9NOCA|nr:HTH-type transcriptional regulator EthR [Nocardia cerradoensis]